MTEGQKIVNAAREWLRRYTVLTPAQNLVLTLWALHTHVYERLSRTTPYIELTGVSGSGKTAIMEAIGLLSRGYLQVNTIRTPALCRYIKAQAGEVTIGVDEAERLTSGSYGDMRSMLASGYRQGGFHLVTEGKEVGQYPTWCPKLFTSTATMTAVLHNRAIPIWCERARPVAAMSLEQERAEATAAEVVSDFRSSTMARRFQNVQTFVPDWLVSERDIEIWTPIFTLARTMQVDDATMQELQAASVDLSALRGVVRELDQKAASEDAAEKSYAVRVLSDCQMVLTDNDPQVIATDELLARLRGISTGPWRHYRQSGITDQYLGHLLGVFGVEPKRGQTGRGATRKQYRGYDVAQLRATKP